MSNVEFRNWISFYKDFPFDDYHIHIKPAAIIAAKNGKLTQESLDGILNWLQPEQIPEGLSQADYSVLKAFGGKIKD